MRPSSASTRAQQATVQRSGAVDDVAVGVESRPVAGTVPGFFSPVPVDDADRWVQIADLAWIVPSLSR